MITFLVIAFLAVALVVSAAENCHLLSEVQRLTEARHTSSRPRGELTPARPGTTLVSDREAAAHADAMWKAGEPYLPQPDGRHTQAWPRQVPAWQPVAPEQTADSAPWETPTAAQPVLTQEMQDMRAEYIASRLREAEKLTPEVMREAMESAPGYGEKCVADVLAAEQEGRQVA